MQGSVRVPKLTGDRTGVRISEPARWGSRALALGQAGLGVPPGVGLAENLSSSLSLGGVLICKAEPHKDPSPRLWHRVCYPCILNSVVESQAACKG